MAGGYFHLNCCFAMPVCSGRGGKTGSVDHPSPESARGGQVVRFSTDIPTAFANLNLSF